MAGQSLHIADKYKKDFFMLSPYLENVFLIWLYMSLLFILALLKRDNSIADVGWGVGFILVAWWQHYFHPYPGSWLPALLVSVWGLRLALHIGWRKARQKGEDWRYARWRQQWGRWAVPRAYLQVFLLQGFFMWVIALPLVQAPGHHSWPWAQVLGIALWAVGFYWEALADWQLLRFKAKPENRGKLMMQGLWRFSRHPNYFGEILLWWGLWLALLPHSYFWLSLASPLVVTWLLAKVSGVPLLEEKYKGKPEYEEYSRDTPGLFPKIKVKG
jgi:steroid 5-alpha reductase family enzyme